MDAETSFIDLESDQVVIKIYMKPFSLECSYDSREAYCDALYKIIEVESYVESLRKLQFFPA